MAYEVKVYVVQRYERDGTPGEVIAAKLTHNAAHTIAKKNAPARVIFTVADKSDGLNVEQGAVQSARN